MSNTNATEKQINYLKKLMTERTRDWGVEKLNLYHECYHLLWKETSIDELSLTKKEASTLIQLHQMQVDIYEIGIIPETLSEKFSAAAYAVILILAKAGADKTSKTLRLLGEEKFVEFSEFIRPGYTIRRDLYDFTGREITDELTYMNPEPESEVAEEDKPEMTFEEACAKIKRHARLGSDPQNPLQGIRLDYANLDNANLSNVNLSEAELSEDVSLRNANLRNVDLTYTEVYADLRGADLTGATFKKTRHDWQPELVAEWCNQNDLAEFGQMILENPTRWRAWGFWYDILRDDKDHALKIYKKFVDGWQDSVDMGHGPAFLINKKKLKEKVAREKELRKKNQQ